jgi:large-conductance mechanosensitive channel
MNIEQAIEQKVKELEELFEQGYNFEFLNQTKTLGIVFGAVNGAIILSKVAHLLSPAIENLTEIDFKQNTKDYKKEER